MSEALALTRDNISCTTNVIYVDFHRLKGSKQTDPIGLPNAGPLTWICNQYGKLFPFSRRTGHRIVKRVFSELYPHYFRANRITDVLENDGIPAVKSTFGVSLNAVEFYVQKVDIRRVTARLLEEVKK